MQQSKKGAKTPDIPKGSKPKSHHHKSNEQLRTQMMAKLGQQQSQKIFNSISEFQGPKRNETPA